ncbi:MAG: helix-turn-helix transcriptional regulator [Atopobiaceae bacterium]|nr:helix-turn-helix transcriptional regulator [Atopobiaceae bacterium]
MTDYEIIGSRIARVRSLAKLKQVDLGAAIGVSDQTISNWEVGLRTPRADLLKKQCITLDCSADYLLGLSDECRSGLEA